MTIEHLYQRPGFLLRRAHQISVAIFEKACAELSLTSAQYGVLTVLAAQPGIDQTHLSRALGFDKVTVLRVLKGLEERGLCKRRPTTDNRRQMAVQLTASGSKLLKQAEKPVQQAYEKLLNPFNPAQRQALLTLLQTLNTALEDSARAPFVPWPQVAERPRRGNPLTMNSSDKCKS